MVKRAWQLMNKFLNIDFKTFLSDKGFKKKMYDFRQDDYIIQRFVSFQPHSVMFTINLGINWPYLDNFLPETEYEVNPFDACFAHIRKRIGMELNPKGDKWWGLSEESGMDALSEDVFSLFMDYGYPWLMKWESYDTIINLLDSDSSYTSEYLLKPAVYLALGKKEKAIAELSDTLSRHRKELNGHPDYEIWNEGVTDRCNKFSELNGLGIIFDL